MQSRLPARRGRRAAAVRARGRRCPTDRRRTPRSSEFLDEYGSPATVASAGGRYFGFVTGGALPATVACALCSRRAWDQNAFSFTSSPAAALFDEAAIRWLRDIFGLPAESAGAFVVGASAANFAGLAAARHAVLARAGWNVEEQGLRGAPRSHGVVGTEAHATINKLRCRCSASAARSSCACRSTTRAACARTGCRRSAGRRSSSSRPAT